MLYQWLPDLFEAITAHPRTALLAYYRPHEQLTDEQAIVHRQQVGREQPSLPNRTGKAATQLDRLFAELKTSLARPPDLTVAAALRPKVTRLRDRTHPPVTAEANGRRIVVRPQHRADPDYQKMNKALLPFVTEQQRPRQAQDDDPQPPAA